MGANEDYATFEAPSEGLAITKAKAIMAARCHEDGHGPYGGHLGIAAGVTVARQATILTEEKARELIFGTYHNGEETVAGLAQKWGPAVLVQIRNKGSRARRWILGAVCAS